MERSKTNYDGRVERFKRCVSFILFQKGSLLALSDVHTFWRCPIHSGHPLLAIFLLLLHKCNSDISYIPRYNFFRSRTIVTRTACQIKYMDLLKNRILPMVYLKRNHVWAPESRCFWRDKAKRLQLKRKLKVVTIRSNDSTGTLACIGDRPHKNGQ